METSSLEMDAIIYAKLNMALPVFEELDWMALIYAENQYVAMVFKITQKNVMIRTWNLMMDAAICVKLSQDIFAQTPLEINA